jgi:hypothetical protein
MSAPHTTAALQDRCTHSDSKRNLLKIPTVSQKLGALARIRLTNIKIYNKRILINIVP